MKALFQIGVAALFCIHSYAQGTLDFQNLNTGAGLGAPFFQSDGVTRLSGAQFSVELLAGSPSTSLGLIASTGFLSGAEAGYFNGGIQMVPGILAGETAWVQIRVWNLATGSSFNAAMASGLPNAYLTSPEFKVVLGDSANPAPLSGLTSLQLGPIPEPSSQALLLLALGVWSISRIRAAARRAKPTG